MATPTRGAPAHLRPAAYPLHALTEAVAAARRPEEIYRAALVCLEEGLGVTFSAILLFDRDGVMRFKEWTGLSDEYRAAVEGHSPWSVDTPHPEPVLVPDALEDDALAGFREVFVREGIASLAFIPLALGDRLLGKFMLYYATPHTFEPEEIVLARTVAAHVALAIQQRLAEEEHQLSEALLAGQKETLELIVRGASLPEVLGSLARTAEALGDGRAVASIMLLDDRGLLWNGASPSLPGPYLQLIDGVPADAEVGTCCAAAARNAVVISRDMANDPAWRGLSDIPVAFGLRASWAQPIVARDGSVLGTFGTYFRECREPTAQERQVVEVLSRTAAIAIESARWRAERRDQRSHLEALSRSAVCGIVRLDADARFVLVNDRMCEITGRSREALLSGVSYNDITMPDDVQATRERFASLHDGAVDFTLETQLSTPGGGVWALSTVSALRDTDGTFIGSVAIVTDITDRKSGDIALRESEQRYRGLVEALVLPVYTTDRHGRITMFNEAAAELWGRRPTIGVDEWCGSWRLYYPDGSPMAPGDCPMAMTVKEDRSVRGVEILAERPDGSRVSVLPYPTPIHDAGGALTGAVNVLVDISDRKAAEAALRESEERFRTLADSAPAMIWMAGGGQAAYLSKGLRDFTGLAVDSVGPDSWDILVHPEDSEERRRALERAMLDSAPFSAEYRLQRADGAYRWVMEYASPTLYPGDGSTSYVGSLVDLTKHHEGELRMREAALLKDQFLGLISHELRTPISIISGNGLLLQRRGELLRPEDRTQAIADIVTEAGKLDEIIEKLLLLTQLEGGQVELEPIPLAALVKAEVGLFQRRNPSREIQVATDPALPDALGQPMLVALVIQNLLANADKYSGPGVPIGVRVRLDTSGRPEVTITDSGIGLEPGEIDNMFVPFYRSPRARYRAKGVGLGLAVCKRIADAHGGEISGAARDGGGAEFRLALAVAEPL